MENRPYNRWPAQGQEQSAPIMKKLEKMTVAVRQERKMETDPIGERGEWKFCILMTQPCANRKPLFRPRFLGEKHQSFRVLITLSS
jgi:hypothetical protein